MTLGHKCKKYRKQFCNQIESNCTSGILPSLSPTISFLATSDHPIESNTFANGPNVNFQLHRPTIYTKEMSNVEIQTASIETENKFTQTEGNSVDICDIFMQSEQIDNYQQSKSTQFNLRDFLSGKKLQSRQYLNSIIDFLNDTEIGVKFATFLENIEQTIKFLSTIKAIALGKLKCSNMSWKAALDMCYLSTCETTSKMVYDKEWLEFCQVVYHMFSGGIINTLHGREHFSHVTSEKSPRGLFKPVEGEFNFPVPSITMLKKLDIGYPTEVLVELYSIAWILHVNVQRQEMNSFSVLMGNLSPLDVKVTILEIVICGAEKDLLIYLKCYEYCNTPLNLQRIWNLICVNVVWMCMHIT